MSYSTIKAGSVLQTALRARGFDPDYTTLTVKEREIYAAIVNQGLRAAWEAERWPQLLVTERRQYRPTWSAEATYNEGNQVYYGESYWGSLKDANVGNTPEAGAYWELLDNTTMICFLPMAQSWLDDNERTAQEFDASGVDLREFAYDLDPLLTPRAKPVAGCVFWQDSVVLPADGLAPLRPYVRFRPVAPEVSYTEWAAGTAYAVEDLAYVAADLKCYRALAATTGEAPGSTPEKWAEVGIPKMFGEYLRLRCRADAASDDEGKWKSMAEAEAELDRLRANYLVGSQADARCVVKMAKRGV